MVVFILNNQIINCLSEVADLEVEIQNIDYFSYNFLYNNIKYKVRIGRKTPKKTGVFVAMWEKIDGVNKAFKFDEFEDFLLIFCISDNNEIGVFKFSKQVLLDNHILNYGNIKGKMGYRLYPPWSLTINSLSIKTAIWQREHFIYLGSINSNFNNKILEIL